jgi:arginase family enzyme
MKLRIIDLDGSITAQSEVFSARPATVTPARGWAPRIRLACSFQRFRRFQSELTDRLGTAYDREPAITFYGSGDFHHVSLALVRRIATPINLLVIDNHPDWMRSVPFLHCGTWLYHAARLPQVERVFHVGGDVDFDNYYRPLAPWPLIRSGKICVIPAVRRFRRGGWAHIPNEPITERCQSELWERGVERIQRTVRSCGGDLAARPLYISLDKDVMLQSDAIVNWDSGHLTLAEIQAILRAFLDGANGRLAGMDIVGDWSPVNVKGGLRRLMDFTMHPTLSTDANAASQRNAKTNLVLLECIEAAMARNWKRTG